MLHSAFQATTGISLNTGSGIDAFGPHEPLCLLNILFLFCFFSWSLIFPISFWFFMATSSRPQSLLWFFHWSSSASSRLPLPGLLSWNPSAAAGTLNCQVQTWVQYFWHLLLGFSGVILPIRDVPFTSVSFFFWRSLKSPSLYSKHSQAWGNGGTLLKFGVYFSIFR